MDASQKFDIVEKKISEFIKSYELVNWLTLLARINGVLNIVTKSYCRKNKHLKLFHSIPTRIGVFSFNSVPIPSRIFYQEIISNSNSWMCFLLWNFNICCDIWNKNTPDISIGNIILVFVISGRFSLQELVWIWIENSFIQVNFMSTTE